jgi:hypothetical protein
MAPSTGINRDWVVSELSKRISAERFLSDAARARAESPPDPTLVVLYNEIAAADERHVTVVETIATRYGHTPSRSVGGGVGATLGHLKDKVAEIGASPLDRLSDDLAAKANMIHWYTGWVHVLEEIADAESARELGVVLAEEQAHREALQQTFNRMIEQHAREEADAR